MKKLFVTATALAATAVMVPTTVSADVPAVDPAECAAEVTQLRTEVADLTQRATELDQMVRDREYTIARKQRRIEFLRAELRRLRADRG